MIKKKHPKHVYAEDNSLDLDNRTSADQRVDKR